MKLLIVDDEHFTCNGLRRLIEGFDLGFSKILAAMSGERALEIIGSESPEIILCDIRMPGINGLDMARSAKNSDPDCQILFMSGYNDREYIKTALDIQALAFIDKPIDEDELLAALEKAVFSSRETMRARSAIISREQEETAKKLLNGSISPEELRGDLAEDPRWVFRCVLLFPPGGRRDEIDALLRERTDWGVYTSDGKGNGAILLKHRSGKPCNAFYNGLLELDEGIRLAVGHAVRSAAKLAVSCRSAACALDTLFYHSANRLIHSDGLPASSLNMTAVPGEYEIALGAGREQAMNYLEELRNRLLDHPYTPPELVKSHYYEMLCLTAALFRGDNSGAQKRELWDKCRRTGSLQELEQLVWEELSAAEELSAENTAPHMIRMARKYIQENFGDTQLNIADIARHVHSSVGHLRAVFKMHTGSTLLQYITFCRIEYAKRQLVSTNQKIQEIARGAGYNDPYYFSRIFQRESGMTPQQYRMTMYKE